MRPTTRIRAVERLQIMFSPGNETCTTKGNGSGTPGLFPAWDLKWVEVVGKLGRPTLWRITAAGQAALDAERGGK